MRRSVAGDPDFEVKEDQKIIGAAKGAAALTLPFALSAKDAMGTEVFQLWVVSASSEPLFGVKTSGLKNDGTKVSVDPVTAPLPGATRASLYLETPSDFLPGSKISEYKLSNLSLELVKIIAPIQQERQTYIKQRDAVTPPTEQSLFDEFTAEAQTFLSKDGLSRLTGIATNPRHKLCGAMLRAFSDDWEQLGLSTAKAIPNRDAVFAKGTILLDEQLGKQKADEVEKAIKDALLFVRGITKHEKLSGPDKVKVRKLTALENMIVLAGADAEEAKTLLAQRIKYADQQRERADKKVKDIDSLPLLNRAIPPGKYRLLVGIGSSDSIGSGTETKIPLWDFTIQIPDSLK